jgi:hypothetical protein
MKTTINGIRIHILQKGEQRIVYMNSLKIPHLMTWNKRKFIWEFISQLIPEELNKIETEVSNFIINTERKKQWLS